MLNTIAWARKELGLPSLCGGTVRDVYLSRGIRYRRAGYEYAYKARAEGEIRVKQREFAYRLTKIMQQRQNEVVYIDETSFHLW